MKKIIYGLSENTKNALIRQKETLWINSYKLPYEYTKGLCDLIISDEDIKEAEALFLRFSPFIKAVFPETESDDGIIESPLTKISNMKKEIEKSEKAA